MQLVWQDNFDYTGPPDSTKWEAQTGGHGWGNNELQFYTESGNAWVENGKLIIEARREDMEGKEVTSARLRTRGMGDWQYGRIEARARLPKGLGVWPAIWMMPSFAAPINSETNRPKWPDCGEIDIMEHVAYMENTVHATVHTGAYNHIKRTQRGGKTVIADITDEFHLYSVEWDARKMVFRVDDEIIFTYAPWEDGGEVTDAQWPFDKPFHLIVNLAFGGNWGGAKGVDMSVLPARFEIDYVRVYQ